jgi:SAM-dependent methyltransferase
LGCGAEFPVNGGIVDFCPETNLYWGELSEQEMGEVLDQATKGGYLAGADVAIRFSPGLADYLLSERRIDWLFHAMPLAGWQTCLDIGSGWGTLSRLLAQYFPEVWSLEVMRQRLEFQSAFKQQEGLNNLHLVRGSSLGLPFADASFDLVAANGIIQWVGLADLKRPVRQLQIQFLCECLRILRPGGMLFMGCENRYGLGNLMGAKDHSGLRFTSVMPRAMANWTVRKRRKTGGEFVRSFRSHQEWDDYRTYTYSVRGYKKLLRQSGFTAIHGYWVHPDNNLPEFMGRIDDGRAVRGLFDYSARTLDLRVRGSAFSRAAIRNRMITAMPWVAKPLAAFLSPGLIFVAARNGGKKTLEDAVGPYRVRASGSNKVIWWAAGERGNEVVKLARFPKDQTAVEYDEELFGQENDVKVQKERVGDWTLFREPILDAEPVDPLEREDIFAALDWLLKFQDRRRSGHWSMASFQQFLGTSLAKFNKIVDEPELREMAAADCGAVIQATSGTALAKTAEHGDVYRNNILKGRDGRIYLLDWSHSIPEGDPFFDFVLLSYTHWEDWKRAEKKTGGYAESLLLKSMIDVFCKHYSVEPTLVYSYYPIGLIRRIVRTAPFHRRHLVKLYRERSFPKLNV